MKIRNFLLQNKKLVLILALILIFQLIASSIANADALSEAIANQNSLEQTGVVSGGNAQGSNTEQANASVTKPQSDFDSSIGPRTMKEVVKKISDSLNNLEKSTTISNLSDSILTMLVALLLAWALIKSMFGGGFNQFIESGIHTFMLYGIVYALLNAGGIQAIASFIDSLASMMNGGNMSNLSDALSTTIDKTFGSLSSVLSMPAGNSNYKWTEDLDWAPLIVVTIVQLLAKMIAGFLIILAFIIYACNIVLSFASVILAKSFAPLMIPFMLLPATEFIFNSWIKFFISALLVKCVGAFFIKVCESIISSITTVSQSVYMAPDIDGLSLITANFVVYVCLVGMAGLAAYLMTMVPGIANGLMSGSAIATGFKGVGVITNGHAIRGGLKSFDSAARGSASTIEWTGRKTVVGAHILANHVRQAVSYYRGNGGPSTSGGSTGQTSSGGAVRPGASSGPASSGPNFGSGGGAPGPGFSGQSGVLVGRSGNVIPMAGRRRSGGGGAGPSGGGRGGAGTALPASTQPTSGGSNTSPSHPTP